MADVVSKLCYLTPLALSVVVKQLEPYPEGVDKGRYTAAFLLRTIIYRTLDKKRRGTGSLCHLSV